MTRLWTVLFSALTLFLGINLAQAELLREKVYRNIYEAFKGDHCSELGSGDVGAFPEECAPSTADDNQKMLSEFSENRFFNRLGQLEMERLECGRDYWKSLLEGSNAPVNSQKILDNLNALIPKLNSLRKKQSELKLRNAQLQGEINFSIPLEQLKALPAQKPKIDEYEDNEKEIAEMKKVEEVLIAQIPHSNVPALRELVLDKAGPTLLRGEPKLLEKSELDKVSKKIREQFEESVEDLNAAKKGDNGDNYDLGIDMRERLATDDYLLGMMAREAPELGGFIKRYQCQAQARKSGRKIVGVTTDVATLALSGGAMALAKASRVAFLVRFPSFTAGAGQASRVMAMGGMISGGALRAEALARACIPSNQATVAGACSQTPETIEAQYSMGACVFDLSLGVAGLRTPFFAAKFHDQNSRLGQFLREMQKGGDLRSMSVQEKVRLLSLSGKMTDQDRVIAASALFKEGKALTSSQSNSLKAAHNIASDKRYFEFTPEELKQKMQTLKEGGWTQAEADMILRSGLAGQMSSPGEIHQYYENALRAAQQQGQVRSDNWRLYAESGVAVKKDVSAAYKEAFKLYQKEQKIPAEASGFKTRAQAMSERDLAVYENYAATTGEVGNLPTAISRRYKLIEEDIAKRWDLSRRREVYEDALYKEVNQLRQGVTSRDPLVQKRAEEMLKAFKQAFPGLR